MKSTRRPRDVFLLVGAVMPRNQPPRACSRKHQDAEGAENRGERMEMRRRRPLHLAAWNGIRSRLRELRELRVMSSVAITAGNGKQAPSCTQQKTPRRGGRGGRMEMRQRRPPHLAAWNGIRSRLRELRELRELRVMSSVAVTAGNGKRARSCTQQKTPRRGGRGEPRRTDGDAPATSPTLGPD